MTLDVNAGCQATHDVAEDWRNAELRKLSAEEAAERRVFRYFHRGYRIPCDDVDDPTAEDRWLWWYRRDYEIEWAMHQGARSAD